MANATVTVKSAGGDYASLNAALSGESANLTTNCHGTGSAGILTIECYAKQDTTVATTGTGYTTSASYYINIVVPTSERHAGKLNLAKYAIRPTASPWTSMLVMQESYTRVEGVQCDASASGGYCYGVSIVAAAASCVVRACIVKGNTSTTTSSFLSSSGSTTFINCLSYDSAGNGFGGVAGDRFYNCTSHHDRRSFIGSYSQPTVVNCLAAAPTDAGFIRDPFYAGWVLTSCASSDSTADDYAGSNNRAGQTFTFVDEDGDDFHLAAADAGAKGYGASDPGSGLYSDDIDGQTRSGAWDIGCDQYVAAGGSFLPAWAVRRPRTIGTGVI